ncbi:hypothetical protein K469DRAFT_719691 [Zopfia rhizophila CBS 207.26]|uniref:Xylanolytic transcriptional activator regulatory domain-containing protein n=1 Tax=Zopfia rhizophila CBS 207.26 TaxID=1314779 RepID=A0A6A6DH58_9PEZI|nr:hypothetical protein K469DRAFT_719691 [Zopfia rhizophila CBS 207.26]
MRQLGSSLGIPLPDAGGGEASGEDGKSGSGNENEEPLSLLPDQQGQVQYIGPASSFSFHLKLRTLVGRGAFREFSPWTPAVADNDPHALSTPPSATSNIDHNSPVGQPSFREAYENWLHLPAQADPAWLCSFLSDSGGGRVQSLLPVVIFTSSVTAVQALMLAAIHLHNTNHRDACWNLTGTAVRIAFAIGLHQDKVNTAQGPLARELRKRMWWTLYAFEVMQVSSYDRPSAIEHPGSRIDCPNDRIIGLTGYCPPDYTKWFNRLVIHLGSACRAPKNPKAHSSEESYVGPLSPAAGVLRELDRWKESIPTHLRVENADTSQSSFQRPLLLLHAMYHYTIVVLCRAALLTRATTLSKEGKDSKNIALTSMSDFCVESGRALARILIKLEDIGKFDAITWWDIWYSLASASILVLDLVCDGKKSGKGISESRILLSQLAALATKHRRNPHMPGTIEKWASITVELHSMADTSPQPQPPKVETTSPGPTPQPIQQELASYQFHQSRVNSGAYLFADNLNGSYFPAPDEGADAGFAGQGMIGGGRFDRGAQMSFMDFTINNIQDWDWGDLGSLLGNDAPPQG